MGNLEKAISTLGLDHARYFASSLKSSNIVVETGRSYDKDTCTLTLAVALGEKTEIYRNKIDSHGKLIEQNKIEEYKKIDKDKFVGKMGVIKTRGFIKNLPPTIKESLLTNPNESDFLQSNRHFRDGSDLVNLYIKFFY